MQPIVLPPVPRLSSRWPAGLRREVGAVPCEVTGREHTLRTACRHNPSISVHARATTALRACGRESCGTQITEHSDPCSRAAHHPNSFVASVVSTQKVYSL